MKPLTFGLICVAAGAIMLLAVRLVRSDEKRIETPVKTTTECAYDVYQGGVKIDTTTVYVDQETVCINFPKDGVYYKFISKKPGISNAKPIRRWKVCENLNKPETCTDV